MTFYLLFLFNSANFFLSLRFILRIILIGSQEHKSCLVSFFSLLCSFFFFDLRVSSSNCKNFSIFFFWLFLDYYFFLRDIPVKEKVKEKKLQIDISDLIDSSTPFLWQGVTSLVKEAHWFTVLSYHTGVWGGTGIYFAPIALIVNVSLKVCNPYR